MNKEQYIDALNTADIKKDDWDRYILNKLENDFIRGYMTRRTEELGNSLDSNSEYYREELIETAESLDFE
jgi:hypothetical protein